MISGYCLIVATLTGVWAPVSFPFKEEHKIVILFLASLAVLSSGAPQKKGYNYEAPPKNNFAFRQALIDQNLVRLIQSPSTQVSSEDIQNALRTNTVFQPQVTDSNTNSDPHPSSNDGTQLPEAQLSGFRTSSEVQPDSRFLTNSKEQLNQLREFRTASGNRNREPESNDSSFQSSRLTQISENSDRFPNPPQFIPSTEPEITATVPFFLNDFQSDFPLNENFFNHNDQQTTAEINSNVDINQPQNQVPENIVFSTDSAFSQNDQTTRGEVNPALIDSTAPFNSPSLTLSIENNRVSDFVGNFHGSSGSRNAFNSRTKNESPSDETIVNENLRPVSSLIGQENQNDLGFSQLNSQSARTNFDAIQSEGEQTELGTTGTISNHSPDVNRHVPANYNFQYDVNHEESGNNYGHAEERNGQRTTGRYYVRLPDTRLMIVDYYADHTGYHPTITYEGNAVHPPTNSHNNFSRRQNVQDRTRGTPRTSSPTINNSIDESLASRTSSHLPTQSSQLSGTDLISNILTSASDTPSANIEPASSQQDTSNLNLVSVENQRNILENQQSETRESLFTQHQGNEHLPDISNLQNVLGDSTVSQVSHFQDPVAISQGLPAVPSVRASSEQVTLISDNYQTGETPLNNQNLKHQELDHTNEAQPSIIDNFTPTTSEQLNNFHDFSSNMLNFNSALQQPNTNFLMVPVSQLDQSFEGEGPIGASANQVVAEQTPQLLAVQFQQQMPSQRVRQNVAQQFQPQTYQLENEQPNFVRSNLHDEILQSNMPDKISVDPSSNTQEVRQHLGSKEINAVPTGLHQASSEIPRTQTSNIASSSENLLLLNLLQAAKADPELFSLGEQNTDPQNFRSSFEDGLQNIRQMNSNLKTRGGNRAQNPKFHNNGGLVQFTRIPIHNMDSLQPQRKSKIMSRLPNVQPLSQLYSTPNA